MSGLGLWPIARYFIDWLLISKKTYEKNQTARYIGTFRDSVLYACAQHITEKFPRSQFAPWAYVFLADMNRLNIKEIKSELDKEHNLAALRSIKLYYDKSRAYNVPAVNYVSSSIYYTIYQYLTEVLMFDENEMKTNPIAKEFIEEK